MSFLFPELLWLAVLLTVTAIWLLFQKSQNLKTIFDPSVYEKLVDNRSGLSGSWRIALLVLAMLSMIIALARPVSDEQIIKINETAIDVIAALDISRSMEAEDLYPNRLLWGKKKLLDLIKKGDGFRLGVMAFAANAYVVSPITSDEEVAQYLVENLDSASISEKGTDVLQLVDAASKQLKDRVHKYLLLITDGGDDATYSDAITLAKDEGIVVFVLATATEKGAPIKQAEGGFVKKEGQIILTRLNEKIKTIALETGGAYIHSSASADDIDALIEEIKRIATNETIDSSEIKKYDELFSYFLLLSLILLVLGFSSLPKQPTAVVLLMFFVLSPDSAKAGLLDFRTLDQATKAYESKDYNQSTNLFQSLEAKDNDALNYNLANSLYKQKRFKEAISQYEKIDKKSNLFQKSLHNSGNAYAYDKQLEKAKTAYEEALKLGDDVQTRENLEEVLRQMKKNEQQNKKDKKNGQDKKSDKNKEQEKDSDSRKKQKPKEDGKQKKKQQSAKEQEEAKKAEEKRKKEKKQSEKSKKTQEKDKKQKEQSEKVQAKKQASQKDITDKEEHKLLDMLNKQKGQTYRYHIPTEHKKDQHDKPW